MLTLLQITTSNDRAVSIIKAIGDAWELVLILIITIGVIVYRKKLGAFIFKFNKVSGKTSLLEVHLEQKSTSESNDTNVQEMEPQDPRQKENELAASEITAQTEINFYDIYIKLEKGDIKKAESLFVSIQEKETDQTQKEKNIFFFLYLKYYYSGSNTISEIEQKISLTDNQQIKFTGVKYLAECYLKGREYTLALTTFNLAYTLTSTEDEKSDIALLIAKTLYESGKKTDAIAFLKEIKKDFSSKIFLSKIFIEIAKYYDKDDEWVEKCLALELSVANDPNNTNNLFEAAYGYSNSYKTTENKFIPLSLLHYKELLSYKPDSSGALNNIGVAYSELDLLNKGIESYKKAMILNNTLACSNLANKYIHVGFFEEAESILKSAKDQTDVHENVWSALKKIKDNSEAEGKKEEEILKNAKLAQLFVREFAQLFFDTKSPVLNDYTGNWKIDGKSVAYKELLGSDYLEFTWNDDTFNYTVPINTKNSNAVICEGRYSKKGGGLVTTLSVFAILNASTLKLLLYDKGKQIGYHFTMLKE